MRTITINNENDFATIISEFCGKTFTANSREELRTVCEKAAPILWDNRTMDYIVDYHDPSYAPTVHIHISKKNAYEMDKFFKNYDINSNWDYNYLDTDRYEEHQTIEECPTEDVDFSFVFWDLNRLENFVNDIAKKLKTLDEDTNFALNFIFPEGDGAIEYKDGTRDDWDPSLIWKIRKGEVETPNCKMIMFGKYPTEVLYHCYTLFEELSIADWRSKFDVEFVIEV